MAKNCYCIFMLLEKLCTISLATKQNAIFQSINKCNYNSQINSEFSPNLIWHSQFMFPLKFSPQTSYKCEYFVIIEGRVRWLNWKLVPHIMTVLVRHFCTLNFSIFMFFVYQKKKNFMLSLWCCSFLFFVFV